MPDLSSKTPENKKTTQAPNKEEVKQNEVKNNECFVIMPISEGDDRPEHFLSVYKDIIEPACKETNFRPVRADDIKATNLIHLDILQKLIATPIAICDLSTRNPNVLFELGIRQAFDKPVVLIQEKGTPKIFDIAPLRYLEYCKELRYRDVLRTQKKLAEVIRETIEANNESSNANSIVKLLALTSPAKVQTPKDTAARSGLTIELLSAEVRNMRKSIDFLVQNHERIKPNTATRMELERISNTLEKTLRNNHFTMFNKFEILENLQSEAKKLQYKTEDRVELMALENILEKINRNIDNSVPF